jgi:hypothetical protein
MFVECRECLALVECEHPPFICPSCGLAAVRFTRVGDSEVAARRAEGEEPYGKSNAAIRNDAPGSEHRAHRRLHHQ